jgi:hypothetical protein
MSIYLALMVFSTKWSLGINGLLYVILWTLVLILFHYPKGLLEDFVFIVILLVCDNIVYGLILYLNYYSSNICWRYFTHT